MTTGTLSPPRPDVVADEPVPPPRPPRYHRWRFPLVAYGIPVWATQLAMLTWFTPGRFTATGDIPPFVRTNLAHEVTSFWNHQSSGAGSTSASVLQLAEILLLRLTSAVGLGAPDAQRLLYVLCFAVCTFGAAYLAAAWTRSALAVAAAGLLATFNQFLLVWQPNPLPPLAIGLSGVLAGMVVRVAKGRRVHPIAFAAATLPLSYLALNPPWLLMALLTVAFAVAGTAVVAGRAALYPTVRFLLRAAPWTLVLNLWWLVPFVLQTVSPAGIGFSAVTNVQDWSWTQVRNTVVGVVTLNSNWSWWSLDLFPYAKRIDSGLSAKLLYALPLLAFAGVFAAGRRGRTARAAWLVAAVGLVMLFVSTGIRSARFGFVNLWLFDHVPGMWLLREPASKLGVPTILVYSSLAALAIDRALRWRPTPPRLPAVTAYAPGVAAIGLALAALAYPTPMWDGEVIPAFTHGEIPSARVAIAPGWYGLAEAVNARPGTGKVLVLPVNLYSYSLLTDWNYRGADLIPAQLLDRPTVHLLPGGYYADTPSFRSLVVAAQDALLRGDTAAWRAALRALGVDTVVVRHDLRTASFDQRPSADPAALETALARAGTVRPAGQFGVASLYDVVDAAGAVRTGSGVFGVRAPDARSTADLVADTPPGLVAVADPAQLVTAFHGSLVEAGTMTFSLAHAGPYRLDRTGTDGGYRASIAADRLTFTDADSVAVDGNPLPSRPAFGIPLADPHVAALDIDGVLRPLTGTDTPFVLGAGSTVTAYAPAGGSGLTGVFRRAGECLGRPVDGTDPMRLDVSGGSLCTVAPVNPTPDAVYRVHFAFRTTGGVKARTCLWEDGPADCAVLPAPGTATGWTEYTGVTRLTRDVMSARLYLYGAAARDPGTVEFRDVSVTPLRAVGSAALSPLPAPPATLDLAPGPHTVRVDRPVSAAPPEPEFVTCRYPNLLYSHYPTGNRPPVLPDGTVDLAAFSDAKCAQGDDVPVVPGATYELTTAYRLEYGETPRMCVREQPSTRCADLPALSRSPGWQTVRALVHPAADTTLLQPMLYADATSMVSTRVEYRGTQLVRVSPVSVSVSPVADTPPAGPRIAQTVRSSAEYGVTVHGANGPFTVALAESYAPGWVLEGLPRGWTARHVVIDGYANGWIVSGTGDATLTARYGPARWGTVALFLSALGVLATLGFLAWQAYRRRRPEVDT